jgi:activator of HSP90 ATPase
MVFPMSNAIQQSVRFAAPPAELFEMYIDSKKHSAATGGRARISDKVGAAFTAWNGQLRGKNLLIVPNRLVMQAWRATHWPASDLDSILVLGFSDAPGGGKVELLHMNVPAHDHEGVTKGWRKYYWTPWKKYIAAQKKKKKR